MQIEDINTQWAADCSFNLDELASESARIGSLHSKYYRLYIDEKLRMLKTEEELAELRKIKRLYYTGRMAREDLQARGWQQFETKLHTREEINEHIDSDGDYLKKKLALAMQVEKVEYLKAIIHQVSQRSFNIRNAVEWKKFEAGF